MKKVSLILWLTLSIGLLFAQEPTGYYQNAEGKSGQELKNAVWRIIAKHTQLGYGDLWTAYETTDTDEDGYIIDMYNNCRFVYGEDQHSGGSSGNASNQCVAYNREHSMPKDWFDDATPMYTDLHHIYPVSGYINTRRNNYPYAEVGTATFTSTAGSKLGPSITPGFSGTAFEPLDEYKGDLARTYFYMATCYHDKIMTWESDMLSGNNTTDFSGWALDMLLEWHEQDPVSEKEIKRNNEVYKIQKNRNPFIDHPELVEKIWGDDHTPFGEETDTASIEKEFWDSCEISTSGLFVHIKSPGRMFDQVEIFNAKGQKVVGSYVQQDEFGYRLKQSGLYIIRIGSRGYVFSRKVNLIGH